MDLVKSTPVQSVKPAEAAQRAAANPANSRDATAAAAAKKAAEQAQRPTTNMRGETLGMKLNVTA